MASSDKVQAIFRELAGERAKRLSGSVLLTDSIDHMAAAWQDDRTDEDSILKAQEVAFHLLDWQSDAAFLVAIALYPERFTHEEIRNQVRGLLFHIPAHVLEAARQAGVEAKNSFAEGP